MKKFGKILTIILAVVLCLFTPGVSIAVNGTLSLTTMAEDDTAESITFLAPTQNSEIFEEEDVDHYDLASWDKPASDYLVTQQVTRETNSSFHEKYLFSTLSDADIFGHSPYVIATNTKNMPAKGCYTTSAITLAANGYYRIKLIYHLKEQNNNTTTSHAFGTFYLDDEYIRLEGAGWQEAIFYVHTDVLETANVKPELYFGSHNKEALGSIYFDKFTITAITKDIFDTETTNPVCRQIDLSKENIDYKLENSFTNTDFDGETNTATAESDEAVWSSDIPELLDFNSTRSYFYTKNGNAANVMLMKAKNSNAILTLKNYTFTPRPHEVYMFQFYSIAAADTSFYLTINPTDENANQIAQQISYVTNYPYRNGWQLNTIFFVAGLGLNQEYTLGFSLSNQSEVTNWAAIDEFKIYKVNGSYASNNAKALGVHDTNDLNDTGATLDIANGYFKLGKSTGDVMNAHSSYPYPLIANDWTTNCEDTNGIVNWEETLWQTAKFGENPGAINSYAASYHIYMMHNTTSDIDYLNSSAFTTTAGEKTYVSFDAYSTAATATTAWIVVENDGETTNPIKLGNPIEINANAWQHYEFVINEDAYAVSRSYYLRFEMANTGYAYIANVRAKQFGTADETSNIDLTNPLSLTDKIWQVTDETIKKPYINSTATGLTISNTDKQTTVVQNSFAYNLTAGTYEFVVESKGNNAYLGLKNHDGLLEVTTDKVDASLTYEYKLYLHVENDTQTNFQITLGNTNKNNEDITPLAGDIFIKNIKVNTIDETEYEDIKTMAANNQNTRMLVLSPASETEEDDDTDNSSTPDNSFFGQNWWYLIPTLITAIALFLAIATFLFRKIKFDKHITKKNTSYARDMRLKNQQNKIVAQKATKVDNVVNETKGN